MIKIVDPRGFVATEMEPYNLSKDIHADKGAGITGGPRGHLSCVRGTRKYIDDSGRR